MLDYVICECTPLVDSLTMCAPVCIPKAELEAVYVGPGGMFIVADGDVDPERARRFMCEYIGRSCIMIYHRKKGLYSASGERVPANLDEKALDVEIYQHVAQSAPIWDDDAVLDIQKRLRILDGTNRGIYRDDYGDWYISRNETFLPLSEHDPDKAFGLLMFGGILGLHRFFVGRWLSGLAYFLTGGLFGLGWLLDATQMLTGTMKDRKKKVLAKPAKQSKPWYAAGILTSVLLLIGYAFVTGFWGGGPMQFLRDML